MPYNCLEGLRKNNNQRVSEKNICLLKFAHRIVSSNKAMVWLALKIFYICSAEKLKLRKLKRENEDIILIC